MLNLNVFGCELTGHKSLLVTLSKYDWIYCTTEFSLDAVNFEKYACVNSWDSFVMPGLPKVQDVKT